MLPLTSPSKPTSREFCENYDTNQRRIGNLSETPVSLGQILDESRRKWENPSWWSLLVVLPWTAGAILFIYQWDVERGIATREQTTQGVITAHEPANHDRFGYVFTVDGKIFTGWETPGKNALEIGLSVLVYYDPLDPNKNALTKFEDKARSSLGPVPTMLFGIGFVIWYITSQRRKNRAGLNRVQASS